MKQRHDKQLHGWDGRRPEMQPAKTEKKSLRRPDAPREAHQHTGRRDEKQTRGRKSYTEEGRAKKPRCAREEEGGSRSEDQMHHGRHTGIQGGGDERHEEGTVGRERMQAEVGGREESKQGETEGERKQDEQDATDNIEKSGQTEKDGGATNDDAPKKHTAARRIDRDARKEGGKRMG